MMKTTTEYVMLYVPHTEFGYLLLLKKVTVTKYWKQLLPKTNNVCGRSSSVTGHGFWHIDRLFCQQHMMIVFVFDAVGEL